jgi:hypothetical protein
MVAVGQHGVGLSLIFLSEGAGEASFFVSKLGRLDVRVIHDGHASYRHQQEIASLHSSVVGR